MTAQASGSSSSPPVPVALVTGATGFIGFRLVRRLLTDGWQVRCLIRNAANRGAAIAELTEGLMVEDHGDATAPSQRLTIIDGDLGNRNALCRGIDGADFVFHLAGTVIAVNKAGYFRTNYVGTVGLAEAMLEAPRPPRLVFASSLAAGGPSTPGAPRTEEDPDRPVTHYGRSKLAAEQYLRRNEECLWSAIVRPAAVFGPRDVGFASIFRAVSRGFRLGYVGRDMEMSLIYVDNLVDSLTRLAEKALEGSGGPSGEVYYAADPIPSTVDGFQRKIAEVLDRKTIRLPLPRILALGAAAAASGVQRITRRPSFFNLQKVIEAVQPGWVCSQEKLAHHTRGADRHGRERTAVGLVEGIRRTVTYYRSAGIL